MLPATHRLGDAASFRRTTRRGRRTSSATVVTHVLCEAGGVGGARIGFVVSRAVGNSVTRNRVQRRLRHLMAAHLPELPAGSLVVVRAMPPAAGATSRVLDADLIRCLDRVLASATSRAADRVVS